MKAFLDTHAAIALYEGEVELLGAEARDLVARSALFVSPLVGLELTFLFEIGRIRIAAGEILSVLGRECGVTASQDSLAAVAARAMALSWTRDPFDRMLVATAILHGSPFVTRDRRIHEHYDAAVW